jgi:arylsulfatase
MTSRIGAILLLVLCCVGLPAGGAMAQGDKPNFLVIMGDDIDITNISAYSDGLMRYKTPNIDQLARKGPDYRSRDRVPES